MSENIIEKLMIAVGFKTDEASKQKVTSEADALKGMLKKALGAVGITLSIAGVANFARDAVNAASTVEQMEEKFHAVFLDLSDEADQWAGNLAESIGRSKNSIKTYLADQQNLLVGFGMARDQAASMSEEMISAAINIASFNNIGDDEAVNALSKAMMGETESAKRLGAVLNDNTIAMAMEDLGYKKKFKDLDEATKMQVRYHSIVMQSPDAFREENGVIGDAALSMGTYESKARNLSAIQKDIKENIGSALLPLYYTFNSYLARGADKIRILTERMMDSATNGGKLAKVYDLINKGLEKGWDVLRKVYDAGKRAVDMVGGYENALKLLSVAIGTIVGYGLIGKVGGLISKIGGLSAVLGGVNLKLAGMVLLVTAVFLIFDDLIAFMQGRDSLLGDIIDASGGDQQKVRDKLNGIKDSVEGFFNGAKEKLADFGDDIRDAADGLAEFFGEKDAGDMLLDTLTGIKEALKTIAGLAETAAGFIAFITGADDALSGEKNVATSKGTERMSNADAKEYKQLTHDIKGTKGQERERIQNQIDALESKYQGTDTTTAGQKMMSDGHNAAMNSFDRVFGNGEHQSNSTFSDKMAESWNSFKHFVDDSTMNIFHDELFPPVSEASEDTKNANKDTRNSTFKAQDGMLSATQSAMMKIVDIMSGALAGLTNIDFSGLNAAGYALSGVGANMPVRSAAGKSGATVYQTNSFNNSFYGDTRDSQVAASRQLTKDSKDATAKMSGGLAAGR